MSIPNYLLAELEAELIATQKVLQRLPDDKFDFKPHEKSSNLGSLATHLVEVYNWGTTTLDKSHLSFDEMEGPPPQCATTAELLKNLQANYGNFKARLGSASDEHMHEIWTASMNGQTVMSDQRHVILRGFVFNHIVHHRAQLGVYLRLLDVSVPATYGPSADEQF